MRKAAAHIALLLLLAGCRSLQPIELPDESARQSANTPLWMALENERADDWFELLNDGDTALEWRLRMIDSATDSLDLQTFLWKKDQTGLQIFHHILKAADRGVHIRLLLDDTFTMGENDLIFDMDQHPHIEFRIYNPFQRRYDSIALRQLMNVGEFSRLDHRMHNKVMLADGRVAILGGRNLADEYFGRHEKANFRDLELLCSGSIIKELSARFDAYWNSNWSFPVDRVLTHPSSGNDLAHLRVQMNEAVKGIFEESSTTRQQQWTQVARSAIAGKATLLADAPAQTSPSAADEFPSQLAELLVSRINQSQKELVLVSAYLIPTPELETAVEQAEKRGVNVRILTNSLRSNNHTSAHSAYRHHVRRLINHGADLHEVRSLAKDRSIYMQSPVDEKVLGLHAKLLLIDREQTFIGSANLDPRSLRLNTEIGLLVQSPALNQRVRELLELDFHKRNAWHLKESDNGSIIWVADDITLDKQPADSNFQRIEDWFFSILPIEGKM